MFMVNIINYLYCVCKVPYYFRKSAGMSWFRCICTILKTLTKLLLSSKRFEVVKNYVFHIKLLHANVQCVCIMYAKYQIVSAKSVVPVDFPVYALSTNQTPFKKQRIRNWLLRWNVTKLNNGVRGQKNTPPENSIFWENVSVFSLCVIINPSFLRRHEIGMVLAFLTLSNSRLKLHIFGSYLQTNWSIEMIFTPKCLFKQVQLISLSLILQIRPRNVWSPKSVNLDICKICTFFAFEAKLLEIEAEDTIRFLYYVQVFSVRKRFVKEKI